MKYRVIGRKDGIIDTMYCGYFKSRKAAEKQINYWRRYCCGMCRTFTIEKVKEA